MENFRVLRSNTANIEGGQIDPPPGPIEVSLHVGHVRVKLIFFGGVGGNLKRIKGNFFSVLIRFEKNFFGVGGIFGGRVLKFV